jgi:hypothetical protein
VESVAVMVDRARRRPSQGLEETRAALATLLVAVSVNGAPRHPNQRLEEAKAARTWRTEEAELSRG